jgi:membrane protein implicated in regulation of membrane protease activity
MTDVLQHLGPWLWWVLAGVLLILELFAPGVFLIWLGIAAAGVALINVAFDLTWQWQFLLFAALSVLSVYVGRAVNARSQAGSSDQPHLNQRLQGFVGRRYTLAEPIKDGRGRLTIEDTVWDIAGPDSPKGAHVRVTAIDGMRLIVERA